MSMPSFDATDSMTPVSHPAMQEDYQVSIEAFQGPLDLLLYLIRRAEVDIHDIPIAKITDQYLAFLRQVREIDVDVAGEFLVLAATLVEIKSRTLMPVTPAGEGQATDGSMPDDMSVAMDSSDPRYELVRQLMAYQRFRIASEELEQKREAFSRQFARRPGRMVELALEAQHPVEDETLNIELEDVHVLDLSQAYERIIAAIDLTRLGDHVVEMDDTPQALHQEDLLDRLQRATDRRVTLQDAFEGASLMQRVGLFLATLELARLRRVTVEQPAILSPIVLVLNEDPNEPPIEPLKDEAMRPYADDAAASGTLEGNESTDDDYGVD